jgi:hypothetical protein
VGMRSIFYFAHWSNFFHGDPMIVFHELTLQVQDVGASLVAQEPIINHHKSSRPPGRFLSLSGGRALDGIVCELTLTKSRSKRKI